MPPTLRRIAYVDQALGLGGAEQSLLELLPLLDRRRYEPTLLHAKGASWVQEADLVDVSCVPALTAAASLDARRDDLPASWLAAGRYWPGSFRASWALRTATQQIHPDLIHTNTLKSHLLAGMASRLPRRILVWHVRDLLPPGPARQWLLRAAARLHPQIIAISRAVAQQFAPLGDRVQVRVIYNGVPLERFRPGPPAVALAEELGLQPEDEVVGVVGRLTPWKNHGTLLQALREVLNQRPRARLLVVGTVTFWEESYAADLKAQAAALGLGDRVVWVGFRRDVPELLRLCHVFVLPSLNEPFGRVLVEAMATGIPVIGTCSGGVPEVVVEGECGLLVEPGNVMALAAAITRLLSEPNLAADLSEAAWRRVNRYFAVTRVAREVQEVYEKLLGR